MAMGISQAIRANSGDNPAGGYRLAVSRVGTASNAQKWISRGLGSSLKNKQRVRVYRLITATGKKQLLSERSRWEQLSDAIAGVLSPAKREGQA